MYTIVVADDEEELRRAIIRKIEDVYKRQGKRSS